jgi:hypothetical protein
MFKQFTNGFDKDFQDELETSLDTLNTNTNVVKQDLNTEKNNLNTRIDTIIQENPQPSEVVDARGGEAVLGNRLNNFDAQLADKANDLNSRSVNVKYPPPPHTGAVGDGVVDDTAVLKNLSSIYKSLIFPDGRYKITDQLAFNHGQEIILVGHVVFDGSDFLGTTGTAIVRVKNTGSNYTTLPTLTHDLAKGNMELTFNASHNLAVGDVICLYDNTTFSWSSARDYYKKGEYCRVANVVDSTKVILDNGVFDDYPMANANFGVHKMNMGTFSINGSLEIIQGRVNNGSSGLHMERVRDFKTNGTITSRAKGCYGAIIFEQCFNVDFQGTALQHGESGSAVDYGLAIINSQHVTSRGYFVSSRHAVTHTGKDGVGAIVNRDCKTYGTVKSTGVASIGVCAFDAHGNSENISFEGTCYGGVSLNGSSMKIRGVVYGNKYGICVSCADVKSFDHDLSNTKFITDLDPNVNNRGVIDFGNNTVAEVNFMKGGLFNLSNIDLIAPNARFGVVLRTRNLNVLPNENLDISLQGARIQVKAGAGIDAVAIRVESLTGAKTFRVLNATGCTYKADRNILLNIAQAINPTAIA